jgi:hypothetical protein
MRRGRIKAVQTALFSGRQSLLIGADTGFDPEIQRLYGLLAGRTQTQSRVNYRLPKPRRDGTTVLSLTPLELIDHLAAVIPPPRRHRHRYHGVLAPNAPLRAAATALGRDLTDDPSAPAEVAAPPATPAPNARSPVRYLWAMLLAPLFESLPLTCPTCGADMRIIAFVAEAAPVERRLDQLGEPGRLLRSVTRDSEKPKLAVYPLAFKVRFSEYFCQWQPKGRCLFLAGWSR